jgi:hypothetical protein
LSLTLIRDLSLVRLPESIAAQRFVTPVAEARLIKWVSEPQVRSRHNALCGTGTSGSQEVGSHTGGGVRKKSREACASRLSLTGRGGQI